MRQLGKMLLRYSPSVTARDPLARAFDRT